MEGLGQDLVAMCVNDLACTGARPLVFLDYLAVGRLDPGEAAVLVRSIADACAAVGCALAGGETAEMPGLYAPGHFDLAGFACGVVERSEMLGAAPRAGGRRDRRDPVLGAPLERLLAGARARRRRRARARPRSAAGAHPPLRRASSRALAEAGVDVRAAAHITGGGMPENLPRALPEGLGGRRSDRLAWEPGPAIDAVMATGRVAEDEAWRTFNMGLGMCVVVAPESAAAAIGRARRRPGGGAGGGRRRRASALPEGAGPFRVAVLVSGSGTNLQSLIDSVHRPGGRSRSCWWWARRPDAFGLERARARGHPHRGGRRWPGARARTRDRELAEVVAGERSRPRGARGLDEHPHRRLPRPLPGPGHQPPPVAAAGVPRAARDRAGAGLRGAGHGGDGALRRGGRGRRSAHPAGGRAGDVR